MTDIIRLGISTCPNDTFAFHGLLTGAVSPPGFRFEIDLLDVEELNHLLARGRFDVAKGSFHAALSLASEIVVLPSGSALGFGVGPVLLGSPLAPPISSWSEERSSEGGEALRPRVLGPGKLTTATLLFRLFYPEFEEVDQVLFSEIMPRLATGRADYGICIHEGRFTYAERGLKLVEDLGEKWERETEVPLPLGGIFARRELGGKRIEGVQSAILESLEYGRRYPEQTLSTMRRYAQEETDEVLWKHVELYVNDWTLDLGDVGRTALRTLGEKAGAAGLLADGGEELEIFEGAGSL